jgi:hypothetical protein
MPELKQSTGVVVRVGPVMDYQDGVTPVTTLSLSTADQAELLKAAGAATVDISGRTFAAVTGVDGYYDLTLTTSDTGTLGDLTIVIQDASLCVPVSVRCEVVDADFYDVKYGTSSMPASVTDVQSGAYANVRSALGMASADLDTQLDALPTAAEIRAEVDSNSTQLAAIVSDIAALNDPTAASVASAVWATVCESQGSYTAQQILSVVLAVLAGRTTDNGATLYSPDGASARVAATIDENANRTSMTLTPSS